MLKVIECAGNPRDLGEDQGRACRDGVREIVARAGLPSARSRLASLAAFTSGAVRGTGAGREIVRHYTHQSERIDGLARAAGVPIDSLLSLHTGAFEADEADAGLLQGIAVGATGIDGAAGGSLIRSLAGSEHAGSRWLVRNSRPEVGFSSLDVTLPWLASAIAGVNSAGLCASFVAAADSPGAAGVAAPPALLLVQECLQRFEGVSAGIDWCLGRPVYGHGTIVLSDAKGEGASVLVSGSERETIRSIGEPLVAGGAPSLGDEIVRDSTLDWKPLGRIGHAVSAVHLCATRRSLELRRLTGPAEELSLALGAGEST
jgi:hypothetical protein